MLKVVVGHSEDPESQYAVEAVLDHCRKDLGGDTPQAGILFAAIDFEHALILNQINQEFPGIDLIGCTTDGEMSSILGFQQDSLTLMLFSLNYQLFSELGSRVIELLKSLVAVSN